MSTNRSNKSAVASASLLLALATLLPACQANQTILKSVPSPVPEASLEPRKTDLATDIKDIQDAGIENIFIVRRKDGGVFDKDDKQFLRDNVPTEMDRRISSDDGRAFVLATKYIVPPETVKKWRQRFNVEERSSAKSNQPKK